MPGQYSARQLKKNRHCRLYAIRSYRRKKRGTAYHEAPIGKAPFATGVVLDKT
ncbi:hypothetical protein M153_1640006174 [Pseudoloma neurophilia]|uniref:Uncharacterized protein n=1 Tax=Pseudoloma neurophilia TaxID=146866 RepID=A0A0R0M3K8_9MICR|nr:hypothetical protein M153_1640006174 [Pseudoloma neurophilia]